ncbi:MAG: ATP-dependent DNA helicase [Myxococcales bacterium]|nr:MAG: ATP-dependent DNA helicase [Myxococcales bacterium]
MSLLSDLLSQTGPIARSVSGYDHRPSQLEMAETVAQVLQYGGVSLIEAGTGTGKTLAYLLPAFLSEKRVVVSTATKVLQDQIINKDIPLLEQALGSDLRALPIKGLSNYVCKRRYRNFIQSSEFFDSRYAQDTELVQRWMDAAVYGEISELKQLKENSLLWPKINSGTDTRIGARCSFFEECFVTQLRRSAEHAQVLVVNHHLFFADLASKGPNNNGILPPYDAVIFDEAHQIEDVATEFFGVRVSSHHLETLIRDLVQSQFYLDERGAFELLFRQVERCFSECFSLLPKNREIDSQRFEISVEHFSDAVQKKMFELDDALDALQSRCDNYSKKHAIAAQFVKRIRNLRDDISLISEGGNRDHVIWAEQKSRSLAIGASPIDISYVFRSQVLERNEAVVCTSATLSSSSSFKFIRQRLGIEEEVDEKIIESPFNFQEQVILYVNENMELPNTATYNQSIAEEIISLIELSKGGAFVLCTSLKSMHELHTLCAKRLGFKCLMQGQASKNELLSEFKKDANAVLFGSGSFWEGVDVPGAALRLVIIDKLPFAVPTDPLLVARAKAIEERGASPFMDYQVPSAALALKQGFGRLIRSKSDKGIVAVLDSRLVKKGYGKVLLRGLPSCPIIKNFDELKIRYKDLCPSVVTLKSENELEVRVF